MFYLPLWIDETMFSTMIYFIILTLNMQGPIYSGST